MLPLQVSPRLVSPFFERAYFDGVQVSAVAYDPGPEAFMAFSKVLIGQQMVPAAYKGADLGCVWHV